MTFHRISWQLIRIDSIQLRSIQYCRTTYSDIQKDLEGSLGGTFPLLVAIKRLLFQQTTGISAHIAESVKSEVQRWILTGFAWM